MRTLLILLPLLLLACPAPTPPLEKAANLVDLVDPAIGTGGFGFAYGAAFYGAAAPHGLVKVGPDTTGDFGEVRFLHFSGNWFNDPTILCFSHVHLHGTGLPEGGTVAMMPTTTFSPERRRAVDHEATRVDEEAHPGSYRVRLLEEDIGVELAATTHAAHHRYMFPDGTAAATVVLDLARTITGGVVDSARLERVDGATLRGQLHTEGGLSPAGGYDVFFVVSADSDFSVDVAVDDVAVDLAAGAANGAVGTVVVAGLQFGARNSDDPVQLRVALSYVDGAGAQNNLNTEMPDFGHDAIVAGARDAWQDVFRTVRVFGGSDDDRVVFASALYRSFLMPTIQSDADQRWRGPDGVIRSAEGFAMMTDLSLWDTYRSVQPLYGLLAPGRARDVAKSVAAFTGVAGFVPLWPMATGDANVMIGAPGEVTIADALARGAIDTADLTAAWPVMRAAALDLENEPAAGRQGRGDVVAYETFGYVPTTRRASVSSTLEYNVDDQALAVIADAMGEAADATRLRERARNWQNLYDADTGFLRGKDEAGAFAVLDGDFDPTNFGEDYVEADAWQSLFPMNDVAGMEETYGGNAGVRAKLQALLDATVDDWATRDPASDLFGLNPLPFHWQGNEPSVHVSALPYDLGDRALGFAYVQWVMTTQYGATPEGVPGNDDGGATSAWWVEAALGLHPIAGTDEWTLGTPLFPRVEIDVGDDTLVITNDESGDDAGGGTGPTLDGVTVDGPRLRHQQLKGTLAF